MTNASVKTRDGRRVMLYRSFTSGALSSTLYSEPTKFVFGLTNTTGLISSTDLDNPVPVSNGTVCDNGSVNLTGSLGGDNSTSNTTTYKEGAGAVDATAQNLIANSSDVTKQWTNAATAAAIVATSRLGLWIYIKDATTLAKFLTSGTALTVRVGTDASNYYSLTRTAAQLSTGWNFLTTNKSAINTLSVVGTPGTMNRLDIIITTNNATDTFVAGDVVYDLLRTWVEADTYVSYDATFPTIDYNNLEVTRQVTLSSAQLNGFNVAAIGTKNTDTAPLLTDIDTITPFSKDSIDQYTVVLVDRIL